MKWKTIGLRAAAMVGMWAICFAGLWYIRAGDVLRIVLDRAFGGGW